MTFRTLLLLNLLAAAANALQCDCGYTDPLDSTGAVYTSYFETNFSSSTQLNLQYRVLNSNITKNNALGRYFSPNNVALDEEGVKLTVTGYQPGQANVYGAELETNQTDLWYGSYHVAARLPSVPGTVSAFFIYQSDSNEVDIEYVSKSYPSPVLFSVKPQEFDANHHSLNTTLVAYQPPDGMNLSADFHTFSFTWTPSQVTYFVDANATRPLTKNVPTLPCVLAISHWSDGNPDYSGGPPAVDSILTVQRVWAFYNSTYANSTGMQCVNSKAPCNYGEMVMPTLPGSSNTETSTNSSSNPTSSHKPSSADVVYIGALHWVALFFVVVSHTLFTRW